MHKQGGREVSLGYESEQNTEGPVIWEGVLMLERHHFAATMVNIGSGNNYQWMVNLGEILYEEKDICMSLKCLPTELLITYKGKKLTNHRVEKLDYTLAG